ncbi:MAG: type III pantothenate kinase [Candidatus Dactylopiibacterium carminicum]|uniref:Type III pantothenate kinase n=1 Tax=Candidatus Dactylopiibacterium carminicum TaxID=857335 RepID=A0A272EYS8_9RHOO|nr:type III pantothenate kinase [Candidatus Dactylopiibacterium carminicum]KAF7600785.1 type III pantothenate kinase [Candidatus Dactylopiibacterium carminicum]PAS95284.1 MAG: type III pantothenate kinase [Candidatus Dactylopiibacterium carminicum]PAT00792.1 MAG: hypothetical protein BSR46_00065 [Candidatus Dactylopiibacterium carminicum]
MYLLIDAGNSRIKYAWHDSQHWLGHDSCSTDRPQLMLPPNLSVTRIVASNVAGSAVAEALQTELTPLAAPIEWLKASAERCGVRCAYPDPARLGADRWAAVIAAWHRTRSDCLVVCAGTATTVDLVRADGQHLGGCILPGLGLMRESLAQSTASLPETGGEFRLPAINTADAIATGCLLAQLGAINAQHQQLSGAAPILLTGGHAPALLPLCGTQASHQPTLILDGLLQVATSELPC